MNNQIKKAQRAMQIIYLSIYYLYLQYK